MGAGRPVPDPAARRCRPAAPRLARGVQCPALVGAHGGALAAAAARYAPVGGGLPADPALAARRLLRSLGPRPAYLAAPTGGPGPATAPLVPGHPHRATDPRKRRRRGLRRGEAPQGLQNAFGGGQVGPS